MRLVVLDTNVIVSAGITPGGAPAKLIFDWVLKAHVQVAASPAVVAEYREIVRRPKFHRYGFPPLWLEFLIEESLWLEDLESWVQPSPDPGDVPFLTLAHAAGAWLLTGNLKHFPEPLRNGVTVLSPTDYLAHLVGTLGEFGGPPVPGQKPRVAARGQDGFPRQCRPRSAYFGAIDEV